MQYETLLVSLSEGVLTVTLNRPEAMNTFTRKMMEEFRALWRMTADDDAVRAVVLRAAPGRAFSTGVDVKAAKEPGGSMYHDNIWSSVDPGEFLGPKANRCWKPIVAAVHGLCAGGAFYWIAESDVVICSDDAAFFDPHVTYGMVAAVEPILASYRMPLGDVLRMALMGNDERMSAATALRTGLVTEVVTLDDLWARADVLAQRLAAKPAAAIQGTVRAIWESLDATRSSALQNALKYCQLGNPIGMTQVDRAALMAGSKTFETR